MTIDWQIPPIRKGLRGALDRFIGPGATRAELALQCAIPPLAAGVALAHAIRAATNWTWPHYLVCCLLALDISGGIVTNATSSAKRWYHRPSQTFKTHMGFVSMHLLHLVTVSWLYMGFDVTWILVNGAFLLGSAAIVLSTPHYLQRPVALTAYMCALFAINILGQPAGLEWFLPAFYLKLLVSHLLKEEPYRPANSTDR